MINVKSEINKANSLLESSILILTEQDVNLALDKCVNDVTNLCKDKLPLFVTVMGGAVVFAGNLLSKLKFPLEADHAAVTRYGKNKSGGSIQWKSRPSEDPMGRTIVLVDDLLDEGKTLSSMKEEYLKNGAKEVFCVVWFDKRCKYGTRPVEADVYGVEVPDKFIFGCGMDLDGYWRNLKEVRYIE